MIRRLVDNTWSWPLGAVAVAAVSGSPAVALLIGAAISLTAGNPRSVFTGTLSKYLLQAAVILLGFGLRLQLVLEVGSASVGFTLITIVVTMTLGLLLGRVLRVSRELTTLLSSGTAICGGSAIAAIAPAIGATPANTAASLAIVFLLNAVGLLIFPYLGAWLGLDQTAFGLWAAIAIHDTSSVVGAAAIFGAQALAVATTVKLTRALWILPLSFGCARFAGSKSGARIPWFLGGFLLAALVRSTAPGGEVWWDRMADAGQFLMTATLFLIGAGLTRASLQQIGPRPLAAAVILWILVSALSLAAIVAGWIEIEVSI